MATLDRIAQMQQQGMSEQQITQELRNQGISPKEINDSLNQVKIKSAVSQDPAQMQQPMPANPEMQQSIMPKPGMQSQYPQQQTDYSQQAGQYPPQAQQMQQPPQQGQEQAQYYPEMPQAYPQEMYYPQQSYSDPNTMSEIAEQIVAKKIQEMTKKTGDLSLLKNKLEQQIKDLDERLITIEKSIENLQQAIIKKIGDFSQGQEDVKNNLENIHNTMSKMMNPLIDNYKELQKLNSKK